MEIAEAATGGALQKMVFFKISQRTPVLESLFNKVADLRACNCIKKRLQHRCFNVKCTKFLKTPILKNMCEQLSIIH